MNKPNVILSLEPVQGEMLAKIVWSLPTGHGADMPESVIRLVESAVRAKLHELRIDWNGESDISVQVDPIWTSVDYTDALLDANDATAQEIAIDVLRRTSYSIDAAGLVIDLLGMAAVAEALDRRGWKFVEDEVVQQNVVTTQSDDERIAEYKKDLIKKGL